MFCLARSAEPAGGFPAPTDLPRHPEFPDPLVMFDGRRVTTREQWFNERRPELIALFQHYMYGRLPAAPKDLRAKLEREDRRALGGKATLKEVTVTFGERPPLHLMMIIPNGRSTAVPVVLGLNYFGNHTLSRDPAVRLNPNWMPQRGEGVVDHRSTDASRGTWIDPKRNLFWDIEQIIARGYALATAYNGDIESDPDREAGRAPSPPWRKLSAECGTIGAWAWGLSRAVDYLVTDAAIDKDRIVVTGHSRLGKAALLAAAMDERIALAIPHQAGTGGSGPSRVKAPATPPPPRRNGAPAKPPETVKNLNEAFPYWCNATFKEFNDQPERLPFDQHCLVALCAPRPVLFTNGRADTWINPEGQFEVLRAAAPVYRFLGAGDLAATALPPDGTLIDSALGYFIRPGGHTLLPDDWTVFLDFADRRFGRENPAATGGAGRRVVIDPEHPHSFRHADGTRFFPMGDTAYHLMAQSTDVIAHFIDVRRAHRFNFIRMIAITDGFWPFGGTPQRPDFDTVDEAALRKLDWVFDYAEKRGMLIELLLWGYGPAGGQKMWGDAARENAWVDTLVRRLGPRPNLFCYTITNEFERYPDGVYQYAESDVTWARRIAALIHTLDPGRPVGCHPSVWITDQGSPRPFAKFQGFTQRRPQVVWPLWERSEMNLNVTQNNEGVQTRTWGPIDTGRRGLTYYDTAWQGLAYPAKWTATGWDFEGAGMEDCIAEDWIRGGKPILNTEFGYQYEPGCETEFGFRTHQVHQPAAVRRKAWKIATAGGYFAAGFGAIPTARTLTKSDVENFRPAALTVLYDFFTQKTAYWTLAPHLELVAAHNSLLAKPGVEYVAYFPRGGTNYLDLTAGRYRVEWLHPESGRTLAGSRVDVVSGRREFAPPEQPEHDWVLHLRRVD